MSRSRTPFRFIPRAWALAGAAAAVTLCSTLWLPSRAHALRVATPPATAAPANALVRVVNASADAGPIELWVDGKKAAGGAAAYRKASGFAKIPGGRHKVEAFPTKAKGAGTPLYSLEEVWEEAKTYTVFVCGPAAETSSATLEHDAAAPADGKARIRFFHGAKDLEVVDAAFVDGGELASRVGYASNGAYVDTDPGKWALVVKQPGYDKVLGTYAPVEIKKGKIYTIVLAGPEAKREAFAIAE